MKVLIAIDGSECSEAAFKTVLNRQWSESDQFRIIVVVEPIIGLYPEVMTFVATIAEVQNELVKNGKTLVETKMSALQAKFKNNLVTGQLIEGFATDSLLEESKAWHADLIVLGSHGRKGMKRLFLGSVAETVAARSSCSVEIVKTPLEDLDAPGVELHGLKLDTTNISTDKQLTAK